MTDKQQISETITIEIWPFSSIVIKFGQLLYKSLLIIKKVEEWKQQIPASITFFLFIKF